MIKKVNLEKTIINTENGTCIKKISQKTGLCQITIRNCIKHLAKEGLVVLQDTGKENYIYLTDGGEDLKNDLLNKYLHYERFNYNKSFNLQACLP